MHSKKHLAGMSIAVLFLGLAIIGGATMALISLFTGSRQIEKRVDNRVAAQKILSDTIERVTRMPFGVVWQKLCVETNAVSQPFSGTCLANGNINPNASTSHWTGVPTPAATELVRRWDGSFQPDGQACVVVSRCTSVAGGFLTDLEFTIYFKDPDSRLKYQSRSFTTRIGKR
jgi:hypothetical protein